MNQVQAVFSAPEGIHLDNPITHPFIVHLGGEKLGYKMQLDLETSWDKNGDYSHLVEVRITSNLMRFLKSQLKIQRMKNLNPKRSYSRRHRRISKVQESI